MCDLTICKLSDCSSPVSGGKEIILLCDKIIKGKPNAMFTWCHYILFLFVYIYFFDYSIYFDIV